MPTLGIHQKNDWDSIQRPMTSHGLNTYAGITPPRARASQKHGVNR